MNNFNQVYTADFETINDKDNNVVYSWGLYRGRNKTGERFAYGIDIMDFISLVKQIRRDSKKPIFIYFHNGAKFDFHFLLPALQIYGFDMIANETMLDDNGFLLEDYDDVAVKKYPKFDYTNTMNIVNDDAKKIYSIKIYIGNEWTDYIEFRDSNLLFPSSLAGYGKTIGLEKLDLDNGYTRKDTYKNISELENDGNELEYLERDCEILYKFLETMEKELPFKKWQMTSASTAYENWRLEFFGRDLLKMNLETGYVEYVTMEKGFKIYYIKPKDFKFQINTPTDFKKHRSKLIMYGEQKIKKHLIDMLLPTEWIEEEYTDLYAYYKGGLTGGNGKWIGKQVKDVIYADINSSYPYQQRHREFPYGPPLDMNKIDKKDYWKYAVLYKISINEVENKTGLPFIPILTGDAYLYETKLKDIVAYVTDIELDRFKKYYKGDYSYEPTYIFEKVAGKEIFGSFIDYNYERKRVAKDPAVKIAAKLFINSNYGKFGQKAEREVRNYIANGVWSDPEVDPNPKYNKYLPIAIWTTAYARIELIDGTGHNFDQVIGYDTDSLMLKTDYKKDDESSQEYLQRHFGMKVHNDELGAWDIEYEIDWLIYRRAKQYLFKTNKGKKILKYAGLRLTDEIVNKLSIDEFVNGTLFNQIRPIKTNSGVVIENYVKELKHVSDYKQSNDVWLKGKSKIEIRDLLDMRNWLDYDEQQYKKNED